MFGFSIVRTKKLNQLYERCSELVQKNLDAQKHIHALRRTVRDMDVKLRENNIFVPDWRTRGL